MIDSLFTYQSKQYLSDTVTRYLECKIKVPMKPFAPGSFFEEIHVDRQRNLLSIVYDMFNIIFKIKEPSMIEELFLWEREEHISSHRRRYFDCTLKVAIGPYPVGARVDSIEIYLDRKVIYVTKDNFQVTRRLTLTVSETW